MRSLNYEEIFIKFNLNLSTTFLVTIGGHSHSDQIIQNYLEEGSGREILWYEELTDKEKSTLNEMFLIYT